MTKWPKTVSSFAYSGMKGIVLGCLEDRIHIHLGGTTTVAKGDNRGTSDTHLNKDSQQDDDIQTSSDPRSTVLKLIHDHREDLNDHTGGHWHSFHGLEPTHVAFELSVFLTDGARFDPQSKLDWRSIRFVGQISKPHTISYQDGLIALAALARGVFIEQPTRLKVDGFYVRGRVLELWTFDRSGIYCWKSLDLECAGDIEYFRDLVTHYTASPDDFGGQSQMIQRDQGGAYIATAFGSSSKLYVDEASIAVTKIQVGPGTTCFRARAPGSDEWTYVVKIKWRGGLKDDRPEEDIFQYVNELRIPGIPILHQCTVYQSLSTSHQRRQPFRGQYRQLKADGSGHADNQTSTQLPGIMGHTEQTDKAFESLTPSLFVSSPLGRPLQSFKTRLELLTVFRDAITAHRSLYQEAHVIHQDISMGNIVIVDRESCRETQGLLIDLDVALRVDPGRERPKTFSGTWDYMAIGILELHPRTYRHELESFLYVFIRVVTSNRSEYPPDNCVVNDWEERPRHRAAAVKREHMQEKGFQRILSEFPEEFDSLKVVAETMHTILFVRPGQDGIFVGTEMDRVDDIYDAFLDAFEKGIAVERGA